MGEQEMRAELEMVWSPSAPRDRTGATGNELKFTSNTTYHQQQQKE